MSAPVAHGPALFSARLKAAPEDFVVDEIEGAPASGSGEHLQLLVEKRGLATIDVVRRLCQWANVAPVAVGYAGLKDKHAVATQRFTVHLPKRVAPAVDALQGDGLAVLSQHWHSRKLPRGGLAGNRFRITLRDLRPASGIAVDALQQSVALRLDAIAARGVPNRFGVQRFGRAGDNVDQARRLFAGARFGRETRSMLISAARSALFNRVLDARVLAGCWDHALEGEVLMLDGRSSVFGPEPITDALRARVAEFDVHPTGPLWGRGALRSQGEAAAFEAVLAQAEPGLCAGLEQVGLSQERRSLRLRPGDLSAQWQAADTLVLSFRLSPGTYATAVLAELCGESAEGAAPDASEAD